MRVAVAAIGIGIGTEAEDATSAKREDPVSFRHRTNVGLQGDADPWSRDSSPNARDDTIRKCAA
jgi:hypothetical protein